MGDVTHLQQILTERFSDVEIKSDRGEITMHLQPGVLLSVATILRDEASFQFNLLVDVCGVDYLAFGIDDWETTKATGTGFGRGVLAGDERVEPKKANRFAVVYHLLSLTHNFRLRLKVLLPDHQALVVDSVMSIWPAANWYEREIFDLFGILFHAHPDLRRIMTDYGFQGHPFRKDFPLIGRVEARYDATEKRVLYEPVSIEMRTLEPKVIRGEGHHGT